MLATYTDWIAGPYEHGSERSSQRRRRASSASTPSRRWCPTSPLVRSTFGFTSSLWQHARRSSDLAYFIVVALSTPGERASEVSAASEHVAMELSSPPAVPAPAPSSSEWCRRPCGGRARGPGRGRRPRRCQAPSAFTVHFSDLAEPLDTTAFARQLTRKASGAWPNDRRP